MRTVSEESEVYIGRTLKFCLSVFSTQTKIARKSLTNFRDYFLIDLLFYQLTIFHCKSYYCRIKNTAFPN